MTASEKTGSAVPDSERTVIAPRESTDGQAPGTLLGNTYRVDALLARGGMGEVYRATHVELGTTHAIKVILPSLADDPKMVQLLIEEARKLSRLRHDAIVGYEGLLRDERGLHYLVMEFVEGDSLAKTLAERRLDPSEVLALRNRLADGLAAAHDKGIIHRDISPENIILPQGVVSQAKLIDFGIAKSLDAEVTLIGSDFAGKYAYASPEQLGLYGGHVDLRSDIYSLGLVLANAAIGYGRKLEMGTSPSGVIAARERVPDLSAVPAELRPVIAPMVAPQPEDRPASMRALLGREEAAAAPVAPVRRAGRRGGAVGIAAGGALLAALLIAGVFIFRGTFTRPSPATLRAELTAATGGYSCAALGYALGRNGSARISGHAASAADIARLRRAVTKIPGIGRVSFAVTLMGQPYCEVVHVLQPYLDRPAPATPTIALAAQPAYAGQRLGLKLGMPNFDGYLYVDYFAASGQVLHLLPSNRDRLNIKPAHNHIILGQPPTLGCWILGGSTGEQFVSVVAASTPLFADRRPPTESAGAYLGSLSKALSKAQYASAATLSFQLLKAPRFVPAAACPVG